MRESGTVQQKNGAFSGYHTFAFGEYSSPPPSSIPLGKKVPPPSHSSSPAVLFYDAVTSVPNICINKWSRQC